MARNSWPSVSNINNWRLSGSEKTNTLLNLINNEPDIDKMYLYAKDPYEGKDQLIINKRESAELKYLKGSKAFIGYSNDMDNIFKILRNTIQIKNQKY